MTDDTQDPQPPAHAPSEEDLFRAFAGENSHRFMKAHQARAAGKIAWSINWACLLAVVPWLFYRKMYIFGLVLAAVPVLLVLIAPGPTSVSASGLAGAIAVIVALLLFPGPASVGTAGIAGILAMTANTLYVSFAQRRIKKIVGQGLTGETLLREVRNAGGTSRVGAILGAVLLAIVVALPVVLTGTRTLPTCDSGEAQELVSETIMAELSSKGTETDGLTFSGFSSLDDSDGNNNRSCQFTMQTADGQVPLFFSLTWLDRFQRTYQVSFAQEPDGLQK